MKIIGIILLLCLTTGINIVHATPPRYVELFDIAVAANKSHLFAFRHLSDNHGSHFKQTITRFLISQKLSTGEVDRHWPIGKVFQDNSEECAKNCLVFESENENNPLDILSENGAIPFASWPQTVWEDGNPYPQSDGAYYLSSTGLMESNEEKKVVLKAYKILKNISDSINPTMELMPDEIKVVDPIEYDTNSYRHSLEGCVAEHISAGFAEHAFFLLACESDGDNLINRFRIYFTIPKTPTPN